MDHVVVVFRFLQAAHELPLLQCGVSLLVRFEELGAGGWDQWVPGVHGIAIDFDVGRRSYSATYLPFVAPEQGWGVRESVVNLVRKAGYEGKATDKLLRSIRLTRYQSSKHRVTYAEWRAHRAQAAAAGGAGSGGGADAGSGSGGGGGGGGIV